MDLPKVTRVYQNHHLDSTRWDAYAPRDNDIIVTTSYKAGTTLTQHILLHLLHGTGDEKPSLDELSPWIDARFDPRPISETFKTLEAQSHRRFVKSHLALDGLPYYPNVKYLIIARDPRDVFMSFANHYANYTDLAYATFDDADRVGDPLPRFDGDVHELWRRWITGGWFEWESEGYPFWGNMHHTQTYWNYRHLANFHFVHYSDLLADLEGSVRRIAGFIELPVTEEEVAQTVQATTFANMKKSAVEADANADANAPQFFTGGQASFIFKGTNGRWKDVLTHDELALYEEAKMRVLTDDCARWLEQGGEV